ncbi:MAG TPA: hypothetical protein VFJ89_14640 [Nocardioides sp.]|nr:hypothetical protein [Nocardioides sp.]
MVRPDRRRRVRVCLVVLAAAVVLSVSGADPAALALLLDVDFLAVTGLVALSLVGSDLRVLLTRGAHCLPVLWVRVGVHLTRHRPRSLLPT